jgi:hypothetical protein
VLIFGLDAVLVQNSEAVVEGKQVAELENWVQRDDLTGRQVNTQGGTKIGTIGDIIFDKEGHLLGFKLSRVYVEGPLAKSKTITRDVVISPGNEDGIMSIDLARAEQQNLKQQYEDKVGTQLAEWGDEVEELKGKTNQLEGETRDKVQIQLESLIAAQDVALHQWQILQQASSEAWEEPRLALDNGLAGLQQALDKAKETFREANKSIGWAEGMAKEHKVESIGWAEGMTGEQEGESADQPEGNEQEV